MKVRATRLGYYNHKRRREGEVFILKPMKVKDIKLDPKTKKKIITERVVSAADQFSELWMELAEENAKVVPSVPQKKFGKMMGEELGIQPAKATHEPREEEDEDDDQYADDEDGATGDQQVI